MKIYSLQNIKKTPSVWVTETIFCPYLCDKFPVNRVIYSTQNVNVSGSLSR